MRLSNEALALMMGEKGYHCGRVVLDFPGLFFVTEEPPSWMGPIRPVVAFTVPRKRLSLQEALSLGAPDAGMQFIHHVLVERKSIWGPSAKRWLLWAVKPDDYADAVARAMVSVVVDYDFRPEDRAFWPAVLATLIADGLGDARRPAPTPHPPTAVQPDPEEST